MFPHEFFKMMADETRLRCLLLLSRNKRLCVQQLVDALGESQPKVSRHLALMRNMGVIDSRREGQWVYYSVSTQLPGWMAKVISNLGQSLCLQKQYQSDIDRLDIEHTCC